MGWEYSAGATWKRSGEYTAFGEVSVRLVVRRGRGADVQLLEVSDWRFGSLVVLTTTKK